MSASAAAPSRAWENSGMARVEWTRTEPGDIEQVVSMLLCRENPSAIRIRPSRGTEGLTSWPLQRGAAAWLLPGKIVQLQPHGRPEGTGGAVVPAAPRLRRGPWAPGG